MSSSANEGAGNSPLPPDMELSEEERDKRKRTASLDGGEIEQQRCAVEEEALLKYRKMEAELLELGEMKVMIHVSLDMHK
jgi:hypothetical protein